MNIDLERVFMAQHFLLSAAADTYAAALLDHAYKFTAGGVPQCLHNLDDDRIAQRRVRHIEIALDHRLSNILSVKSNRRLEGYDPVSC